MNIGGRRITNADLCTCLERLGLTEISAFLASGNVVFQSRQAAQATQRRICNGLAEQLGYEVPTFLRTAAEVRAVASCNPFAERPTAKARGKLQVAFLDKPASRAALTEVMGHSNDDDWLAVEGRQLYWLPRGGLSESDLHLKAIEKLLGAMTIRTKNTVNRLAAKYFAP